MKRKSIGDRELALLQHLDQQGESSVGEIAAQFGEPSGLARSTVLTMMERLRAKGYLKRRRIDGMYRYSTTAAEKDVVNEAVGAFVERTLQGSVSPFVAWLSRRGKVSDDELAAAEEAGRETAVNKEGGLIMETFIASLLERLLMTSVQTALLAAVVWLLCRALPRLSPATQCWLWWLVALQVLVGLCVDPVQLPWLPQAPAAVAIASPADLILPGAGDRDDIA